MADDNQIPPYEPDEPNSDIPEIAPSTIFVELMRQAAAKRTQLAPMPEAQTPPPPIPPAPKPVPNVETSAPPLNLPPETPATPTVDQPNDPASATDSRPRARRQRLRLDPSEPLTPVPPTPEAVAPPVEPLPSVEVVNPVPPVAVTPTVVVTENDEKLEAQRIQRVKRRREKARQQRAGVIGGFLRTAIIIFLAGGLTSTIFTWFTSPDFLDRTVASGLVVAESTLSVTTQPTLLPTPNYLRKIGIVSGHRGPENDPGAVCPDGLTEASINFDVATRVVRNLRALGYSVDLLDEFDERLNNYQAAALVSIHSNTCQDFGEFVSGFLVAKAAVRPDGGIDDLLSECIAQKYALAVDLERRFNLTVDMTDYHTFREIHQLTPASIIELGFMKDDREVLTTQQDAMAQAITDGILCFLQPDPQNPNALLTTPSFFEGTPTALPPTP